MGSAASFTELLVRHRNGSAAALGELLPVVYDELRELARRQLRTRQDSSTLQPTALVHEAWLRLADQQVTGVADRAHFHGICARVMRQILVDHARARQAKRRGGGQVARLQTDFETPATPGPAAVDVLALDEALTALAALDARKARVVELRIFAGLSTADTAAALAVSTRTVEADWFFARAWLRGQLQAD
jgi:RNA polymerase sigma factor (TIGR02999 family)